jgi:hypothetical protein
MDSLAPTDFSQLQDAVTEDQPRFALDSRLHVQFYLRPVLLTAKSEEAQRPIYQDVEHIRILVPGDKLNIVDRIASGDDKQRFAEHYARFRAGRGEEVVGTRLEAVPWVTRSKVEEYRFFGIVTVEQLAEASDSVGQKFPGFQADRLKAQKWLEATTGTNARVSELEEQVKQLLSKLEAKPADVPKGK